METNKTKRFDFQFCLIHATQVCFANESHSFIKNVDQL